MSINNLYNSYSDNKVSQEKNYGQKSSYNNTFYLYDAKDGSCIAIKRPAKKDEFVSDNELNLRKEMRTKKAEQARKKAGRQKIALVAMALLFASSAASFCTRNKNSEGIDMGIVDSESIVQYSHEDITDNIDLKITNSAENFENLENSEETKNESSNILTVDEMLAEIDDESVQDAYGKIMQGLETFSSQLGEDGLALIKERVELLGNGEIDVMDVLKILWIESNGRIYDNSGQYLQSYTGEAHGPFQLTQDTIDYLNNYYGLEGDNELNLYNPYDNLDACIYNLRFLKETKEQELIENGIFATGNDDVKEAVFWGYFDGAWAHKVSYYGWDYIEKYRQLSTIDEYPELVASILKDDTFYS